MSPRVPPVSSRTVMTHDTLVNVIDIALFIGTGASQWRFHGVVRQRGDLHPVLQFPSVVIGDGFFLIQGFIVSA